MAARLTVTPGQVLYVAVGSTASTAVGFNGGALQRGGGASDVRTLARSQPDSLASRLIVAAGGGGAGNGGSSSTRPGHDADTPFAGNCDGATATVTGPGAGAANSGGSGGDGATGTPGAGGAGADTPIGQTAGGGAGLYGGGGGAVDGGLFEFCAGGGGSSLVPPGGIRTLVTQSTSPAVRLTFTRPPSAPARDSVKPLLSRFGISPSAFTAAGRGPAFVAVVGGRVSYRLSEGATTTFTVQRARRGRRKGKSCRIGRKTGKRCTRYRKVKGSFKHSGAAGLNSFRFRGRVRGRKLRKGRYRLAAAPADASKNKGKTVFRKFRIK